MLTMAIPVNGVLLYRTSYAVQSVNTRTAELFICRCSVHTLLTAVLDIKLVFEFVLFYYDYEANSGRVWY